MKRLATLLALVFLAPATLGAQDLTQMEMAARSAEAAGLPEDPAFLAAMQQHGRCAARGSSINSRNVMRGLPGSKVSQESLFYMFYNSDTCTEYGRAPAAAPGFYRGVVAEYYLKKDFSFPDFRSEGRHQRIYPEPDEGDLGKLVESDRTAVVVIEAGRSLAASSGSALEGLFATAAGSEQEATAINALLPVLVDYLPRGTRLAVHPFLLRGYLAEGAYRHGVALKEGAPDA